MTENDDGSPERPEPPLATKIANLFEATHGYKVIQSILQTDWFGLLITQGMDEDEALSRIESNEMQGHLEFGLIGMIYQDTLEASGLSLVTNPKYFDLLIVDASKFCDALENIPTGETGERLQKNLTRYFESFIIELQDLGVALNEAKAAEILGEQFSELRLGGWDDVGEDEKRSMQQILVYSHGIAERLEAAGCDPLLAEHLRNVGDFMLEGNLMQWAVAGRLGLLPEIPGDHLTYQAWETIEAWQSLFLLLDHTKYGSKFYTHLVKNTKHVLEKEIERLETVLGETYEDYRTVMEERARSLMRGGDTEDLFAPDKEMVITAAYLEGQDYAAQRLQMLQSVQQQLELVE